ncbi:hypothetical protein [Georgenia sp. SUBG003]|uniref:hypothetical protein n=1 Tax=Georgenia sp. SUBG003 TaxID=1497974 RepID=UPI000693EE6A
MSANDPQPRYGENPPSYGDQGGQPYGQEVPAPQYGQQAPQYGQQAPQYGQQAPQYGQQAPKYGQPPAAPQYGQGYGDQYGYGQTAFGTPTSEKNSVGTTALVLGIVGIVVGLLLAVLGIALGIAAIMTGRKAKGFVAQGLATNGGAAKAGVVCGIVAVVVGVLSWITNILFLAGSLGV